MKTKSGEEITTKEFLSRWKEGMQNLTPVQQSFNDLVSTFIIWIGFLFGTVALIFFNEQFGVLTYALILIFIGSSYSNTLKLFSVYGQYKIYKNLEKETSGEEILL